MKNNSKLEDPFNFTKLSPEFRNELISVLQANLDRILLPGAEEDIKIPIDNLKHINRSDLQKYYDFLDKKGKLFTILNEYYEDLLAKGFANRTHEDIMETEQVLADAYYRWRVKDDQLDSVLLMNIKDREGLKSVLEKAINDLGLSQETNRNNLPNKLLSKIKDNKKNRYVRRIATKLIDYYPEEIDNFYLAQCFNSKLTRDEFNHKKIGFEEKIKNVFKTLRLKWKILGYTLSTNDSKSRIIEVTR